MDCYQFKNSIHAFQEGTLSEDQRHSAGRHLEGCKACTRLLSYLNDLEVIIGQEKAYEPNPFAATRILSRLEAEYERPSFSRNPGLIRILQPVAIAIALLCGIMIGSYTATKDNIPANQLVKNDNNIEFLRSNLFISEFTDEDKILVINK